MRYLLPIALLIVPVTVAYLVGAFVMMDLNPSNWNVITRVCCAAFAAWMPVGMLTLWVKDEISRSPR